MKTTARDIMRADITVARDNMTIEEAVKLLVCHRITGMPVVDEKGKMVGIMSEFDIIGDAANHFEIDTKYLKKRITYSKKIESVDGEAPLESVLQRFLKKKYRRLPVVDKNKKLIGIISRRDIIRILYYRAKVL